jgi:hypothetical protein
MSIEQKIAEILAESKQKQLDEFKVAGKEGGQDSGKDGAVAADKEVVRQGDAVKATTPEMNPDNARNNVDNEKEAEGGVTKKTDAATGSSEAGDREVIRKGDAIKGMKEDLDAMFGADDLSEEFKTKAATIFEAAVMSRVTAEVARLEEEFEAAVANTVAEEIEGIVEQVDGYLGYIAEQWMKENEIALERGIKSDILESFVDGLKGLFEEHYIDVPEEKYDLLGEMEETISELKSKIDEQVAANVELNKLINETNRDQIVKTVSEGLTDTEAEKFAGLVAEVAYDDAETFETKVKTLRESYFTTKTTSGVTSVVTDTPVEVITESGSKHVDPKMSAYLSVLNNK